MKISKEEVLHVAHLARLNVKDDELSLMTEQLDMILSYVDKLGELDTSGVEPTSHVLAITNAFREDEVRPSLDQKRAVENGPSQDGETFLVPRII